MDTGADTVHWRGVNHLALVTPDMDATVRFWHGVLDARLVATIGTPSFRHYFFDIGYGNTVAFFEVAGAETFAKPAGVPDPRAVQFDHVSFNLPDEQALLGEGERGRRSRAVDTKDLSHRRPERPQTKDHRLRCRPRGSSGSARRRRGCR